MNSILIVFILLWITSSVVAYVLYRRMQSKAEPYVEPPNVLQEDECTNCVRYFDTVICKCKTYQEDPSAFLYPTDVTPDTDLSKISLTK